MIDKLSMETISLKSKNFEELSENNLPILIHGKNGSGASLFSVKFIAQLLQQGNKVLFFTAYPMAKEELLRSIDKSISYSYIGGEYESAPPLEKCLIVESGNINLFSNLVDHLSDLKERIIFIKNIEEILTRTLFDKISNKRLVLSGNLDDATLDLGTIDFKTRIFFSKPNNWSGPFANLEKYAGMLFRSNS